MRNDTVAYYVRKLDEAPQIFGDTRLPSLQFCQRYNRDAHYATVKDSAGLARWVTQKQMRVYGIVARIAMSDTGHAVMKDIATEAQCHTTTVSRTLLKLQGWGLYCIDVTRGRHGGIRVRTPWGESAKAYIRAARQRLWELSRRARNKVASAILGGREGGSTSKEDMDATFTMTFADRVYYERAMLALEDPEGEYEAVHPLVGVDAIDQALVMAREPKIVPVYGTLEEDLRILRERKMRDAALAGDWTEWERAKAAPAWAL